MPVWKIKNGFERLFSLNLPGVDLSSKDNNQQSLKRFHSIGGIRRAGMRPGFVHCHKSISKTEQQSAATIPNFLLHVYKIALCTFSQKKCASASQRLNSVCWQGKGIREVYLVFKGLMFSFHEVVREWHEISILLLCGKLYSKFLLNIILKRCSALTNRERYKIKRKTSLLAQSLAL